MTKANDLDQIIWKGRQWAVTEYGLETVGEPYHYYLAIHPQLADLREGGGTKVYDTPLHMMEKNWLDVDDFVTAWLIALSVHGLQAEGARVQETLRQAMKIRRRLYAPRPGAAPGPKEGGVFSLTELEKFQPDPPWYGSQVLGDVVGGAVQQPIKEAD